ncbi:MAG TPA: hypothetical protein VFU02_00840 [Polyangiaceae bacterium]|nr:hypothetical protein [Polyangiaceae bacterium]
MGTHPAFQIPTMRADTISTSPPKPSGPPARGIPVTGVAGAVFVAIKHFVVARFRPGTLQALSRRLDPAAREALLGARTDAWYPSALLLPVLQASFEELAEGDLARYHGLVYDATLHAMRHAFREAMELGGTTQIVTKLPSLWQRLQRGDTRVSASVTDGVAEIRIKRRAAALDPLYLQTVLAILRALFYAATGVERSISVKRRTKNTIELRVGGLG